MKKAGKASGAVQSDFWPIMRNLLPTAGLLLVMTGVAAAQTFEIGPMGGLSRPSRTALGSLSLSGGRDDDTKMKGEYGYGARFTWNPHQYYGHELGYMRSRATIVAKIRDGSSVTDREGRIYNQQASYNFMMYMMPRGERFRPFITVGLMLTEYGQPGFAEWDAGKSRNYGGNYGGGLKIKLVKNALVRLDARQYLGGKPYGLQFADPARSGGLYRQLEATAGFSVTF